MSWAQIETKLDWNKHISAVTARGQPNLAFLNKNVKGFLKKLRDTAYILLFRPASDHSCSVCRPDKKLTRAQFKMFCVEQLNLFRTILGVKPVFQKCYTI